MTHSLIYKNYDQEALDRQYNNRARVPDFDRIVQRWDQLSKDLRQHTRILEDLPYGPKERELLDIFPVSRPNSPILVFFHGGYWQAMDKRVFHFVAQGFIQHGVTTVLANYPLAPEASMDEIIQSCRDTVKWLWHHGSEYNGDPNSIYITGHSAGGHIVAMLMATRWNKFAEDLPEDLIKGGCAVSGLFDLIPIRLSYLNRILGMDESSARRNSPLRLSPATDSPLIVSVGELESDEYHSQSRDFAAAWSRKGVSIKQLTLVGNDHFSILDQLITEGASLNQAILEMIHMGSNASVPH